jgi:hypothetical protein
MHKIQVLENEVLRKIRYLMLALRGIEVKDSLGYYVTRNLVLLGYEINMIGLTCSSDGESDVCRILVVEHFGKHTFGIPRIRWEDII